MAANEMTEKRAKIDTFHARLADPTIPANEWKHYQKGEVSPAEPCPVCYGGELERGPAGLAWCCDSCTYMRLIHDDTEEED